MSRFKLIRDLTLHEMELLCAHVNKRCSECPLKRGSYEYCFKYAKAKHLPYVMDVRSNRKVRLVEEVKNETKNHV